MTPEAGSPQHTHDLVTTGVTAVSDYLTARHVPHQVLEHRETITAQAEAQAVGRTPAEVAKTVVLHDGAAYLLAIIPASERLSLRRVRDVLGASRRLRMATESEIRADFPGVEVGATPPVGPMLPVVELVDRRLLDHDSIVCAGGDHRHAIVLDPRDVIRVGDATVGDICEDEAVRPVT